MVTVGSWVPSLTSSGIHTLEEFFGDPPCGGLTEKGPHWLTDLDWWSLVSCWGGYGVLLKEAQHWV